ncbi:MAG: xylulokinase [Oscillospiraceae bacterium]|nr:xylulokinase [Oscillospiraceae bacterium]
MQYYLGADIGTSGTKTVLFDVRGTVIASKTAEYPLSQPQNGYAEQNPQDWADAVLETIRAVMTDSRIDPQDVKGIGLSGQMHGLVMLDAENRIIRPAIIWCDQRTSAECTEITERVGAARLIRVTANPALTGFTASKILWVRSHEPENYAKCAHILLPKDYIRFVLTGEYATEVSDASGMQLLDVPHRCWSDEILETLGIDRKLLGRVYESPEITGAVTAEAAAKTGLAAGTPVVGGAGDNAAAAIGTGVAAEGRAFTTIGTSGVVFAHTDKPLIDPKGRVHTFCCAVPDAWHVMGVTQAAGLSLKWFRDQFCDAEMQTAQSLGTDEYALMDKEASLSPIGANRLLYLPYLMGERTPHLDANARGVFFGLSAMHRKRDLIRAVMEGVSFSLRDCLEVLREMRVSISDMTACGGGGTSALWRQMLADLFVCPISTAASREGPALGAAILAMVGTGAYPTVPEACRAIVQTAPSCLPDPASVPVYERYYQLYRELYPQLKGQFAKLAALDSGSFCHADLQELSCEEER